MPHPASRTAPADPAAHAINRHDRPPGGHGASGRQDITDPATGGSRLLSSPCATCILRHGDPIHLGPERLRKIIGQALAAGSFVVCHDTLTYGDYPDYGAAICRGFFEAYCSRSPALILLRAYRRLVEVPRRKLPPRAPPPALTRPRSGTTRSYPAGATAAGSSPTSTPATAARCAPPGRTAGTSMTTATAATAVTTPHARRSPARATAPRAASWGRATAGRPQAPAPPPGRARRGRCTPARAARCWSTAASTERRAPARNGTAAAGTRGPGPAAGSPIPRPALTSCAPVTSGDRPGWCSHRRARRWLTRCRTPRRLPRRGDRAGLAHSRRHGGIGRSTATRRSA